MIAFTDIPWYYRFLAGLASLALVPIMKYLYRLYLEETLSYSNLDGPHIPSKHKSWQSLLLSSPTSSLQTSWFAQYGPTLRYTSSPHEFTVLTSDPVLVSHIHSHSTIFEQPLSIFTFSRAHMGPSLTASAGSDHKRQRRAIIPSFAVPQIRIMTPILLDKANQLVDKVVQGAKESGDQVDFAKYIHQMTVDVIGLVGFDMDFDTIGKGGSELLDMWRKMGNPTPDGWLIEVLLGWGVPVPLFLRSERAQGIDESSNLLKEMGRKLVAERRARIQNETGDDTKKSDFSSNDLITNLLRANMANDIKDDQRMSDEEVLAQIPLFLFAGNTTIAVTLTWSVGMLAKHPEMQGRLAEECSSLEGKNPTWDRINSLPYLEAFTQEVLRLYPAAPTLFRVAQEDTVVPLGQAVKGRDGRMLNELVVKKGTTVHMAFWNMNTSKDVWGDDAEVFKPKRFMVNEEERNRLVGQLHTFGGGARHCIGWRFALAEVKSVLFVISRRLKLEETAGKPEFTRFGGLGLARPKVDGKLEMPLVVAVRDE